MPQSLQCPGGVLALPSAVALFFTLALHFLETLALGREPVPVGQALLGNAGDLENEDPVFAHLPGHGWPLILAETLNLTGRNGSGFTHGRLDRCL